MMRGATLLLLLAGCAHAPVHASAAAAAPASAPASAAAPAPACAEEAAHARIRALTARVEALADVHAELEAVWDDPCLRAFARLFLPPDESVTPRALRDSWGGIAEALHAWVGGLPVEGGRRVLVVPPEPVPALTDEERQALAPWLCTGSDPCGRPEAYIAAAERAFDAAADKEHHVEETDCTKAVDQWEGQKPTPFEAWAVCTVGSIPHAHRFPREALRAPTTGWLVLRGRRGHYTFADEVRAYDLATGAAYVASSASALVLGGTGTVDMAGTDAKRQGGNVAGRVAAEQVREIAFLLVFAQATKPVRHRVVRVPVPDAVPFAIGDDDNRFMPGFSVSAWGSSAQTQIAFALVDGPRTLAQGSFTWPDSDVAAEMHADTQIEAMESGLVRGCAPAKLPSFLGAGSGGVSALDADPARQHGVFGDLDRAIRGLRPRPCPP